MTILWDSATSTTSMMGASGDHGLLLIGSATPMTPDEWQVLLSVEVLIIIGVILMLIHGLHSKTGMNCTCCGFHQTDQWKGSVIMETVFRISDNITNIALFDVMVRHHFSKDSFNIILFACLACSVFSICIAYLLNILSMRRIVRLRINLQSRGPMIWFNKHMLFFVFLVAITCDVYLCVEIISSNIFGMDIFDSGIQELNSNRLQISRLALLSYWSV